MKTSGFKVKTATLSTARLKEVQNQLNERPRHVLDYRMPKEVFEEIILK